MRRRYPTRRRHFRPLWRFGTALVSARNGTAKVRSAPRWSRRAYGAAAIAATTNVSLALCDNMPYFAHTR